MTYDMGNIINNGIHTNRYFRVMFRDFCERLGVK